MSSPIRAASFSHKTRQEIIKRNFEEWIFWSIKRVRFSDPGQEFKSHVDDDDYDSRDIEFAAAVAAAAFAIHSLEEAEMELQRKMREDFVNSRTKTGRQRSRRFSNKEMMGAGSTNKSMEQEAEDPVWGLSRPSSMWPTPSEDRYRNQMGNSSRRNDGETKADAWEKTEMEKIKKRYVTMNSRIGAWENEKKMQAKHKMERREGELEERRALNLQHYRNKIGRIEQVAKGARGQVEEKRRNEEFEVKEKGKKIRSKGKVPVKCFCFYCH